METHEEYCLLSLVTQSTPARLDFELKEFETIKKDEKVIALLWQNLVAAIKIHLKKFSCADKLIQEVLRQDEFNIHALRNAIVLAQKRHEDVKLLSERRDSAMKSKTNILKARIHYSYYLTMVGAPGSVPAFDASFQSFESVLQDKDFAQLPEEDRLQCHWLYAKVLIRTGKSLNADCCSLKPQEKATRALYQLQKLGTTRDKWYISQKHLWLAEMVGVFKKQFTNQHWKKIYSTVMGEQLPTFKTCINRAYEACDKEDALVLARIGKLYTRLLKKARSPSYKEFIYNRIAECSELSMTQKWTVMSASNKSLLLYHRWMDSYIQAHRADLNKQLEELERYSGKRETTLWAQRTPFIKMVQEFELHSERPPRDVYQLMLNRPMKDTRVEVERLLEDSKLCLTKITECVMADRSFVVPLARTMFALGEDFQEVQDLLARVVEESGNWTWVCDAYELWGYCYQYMEDLSNAEKKYMLVIDLAANKMYKPLVAFQEMECILKKRLESSTPCKRDGALMKLGVIYRCLGGKFASRAKYYLDQVVDSPQKFKELLLGSLQSREPSEVFMCAEDLLACRHPSFGPREFITVCLGKASTELSLKACWFIFPRVLRLCLDEIRQKSGEAEQDILVFHSDGCYDVINKWITGLKDVSSINIKSADCLLSLGGYILDDLEKLIKSSKLAVVFLNGECISTPYWKYLNHCYRSPELAIKVVIFYNCDDLLREIPETIRKVKIADGDVGTALCTRHLATAVAKDVYNIDSTGVEGLIDEITKLKLT